MDIWAVGCVLFEALSSKPLFPGKHQLDQIGRINMIIGTPSRNFFESFSQSQKSDMKISFVERPAQNLQDLLPKTSSETLDLLNQMLKYDPDERISASDALGHICFTQFRVMEDMYLKKGLDISFAEFFLQQKRDVPLQLPHLIRHHSLSLDKHHFIPLPQPRKSFEFDRPLIVQPAVKCPKLADIQNRKHSLNESKLSLIYGKSHLKPRK
jgi:renal tumor antigen